MAKKKSLDDMRSEAYRRQDNLASDIDELVDRVHPVNAVTRWKNELVGSVKGFSAAGDEKSPATLPVAIAGGVIGVVLIGAGIAAAIALSDGEEKSAKKSSKAEKKAEAEKAKAAEHMAKAKEKARAAKD
ncbi:MAG: hypothetical protein ACTHV2_08880 [Brachybacterium sp.]|nr:hypothetical protein [Brachybacterium sp.]MDN6327986.1 hypothetical protein [Brachybacterium sp.]MDN6400653.1 hypothetical protein [Brachybacterium sp.]